MPAKLQSTPSKREGGRVPNSSDSMKRSAAEGKMGVRTGRERQRLGAGGSWGPEALHAVLQEADLLVNPQEILQDDPGLGVPGIQSSLEGKYFHGPLAKLSE